MKVGDRQAHKVGRSAVRSVAALSALLFGTAIFLSILAWIQRDSRSFWSVLGFAGLAGVQGLYWLRALSRTRAILDITEDAIALSSPGDPSVVLRWTEIDRVRWKWFRPDGFIELSGRNGSRVRVDLSLEGIDEILLVLTDRLREQFPIQLPLVVSSRTRPFLLAAIFALAIVVLGLSSVLGEEEPAWRMALVGAGVSLVGVGGLFLFLGVRQLRVDERFISIDRVFRTEALPTSAIEEVHIGLTLGQVKSPNVEIRVGGHLRSVLYLGAEPFVLFNSIRVALEKSRATAEV